MLKLFLAATLMLLSLCANAQFSIQGVVYDAKTNHILVGAAVQIEGTNHFAVSDELGHFQFLQLSTGEYSLHVKFLGYAEKIESISLINDAFVDIKLAETFQITDEVVVYATRANETTPTTFTNVGKQAIQKQNFGQDLPILLNWTPSVVTTSDAGTGVGYTGIRIRGSDGTRINVTINGIPYNDSESQGSYWVDIPDVASSAQSIQIQRGVGTSTNGAGAFGASINLQTNTRNDIAYGTVINSVGSFGTHRHTLGFGTGLIDNRWVVDGRVSKIQSDGFIDRASSDLQSYYFSAGYYAGKTMLKAIVFGGRERTYQSWYGVPESRLNNDTEAMELTVENEYWNEVQRNNLLNSNSRTFNVYTYKNQVDDYKQNHYQLHLSHLFTSSLSGNISTHYTKGKGYYEEYRYNDDFEKYGLAQINIGDSVINSSDIIRRRWLDNDFYGVTYSLNYEKEKLNAVLGGGWNRYNGDHFGEIIWAQLSAVPTEYRYYLNNGDKRDFNTYLKTSYHLSEKLNAFVDLQYRHISYATSGVESKQNTFDINTSFDFFNPKAGITFELTSNQQLYGSYGIANREPVRDDFVDALVKNKPNMPKHEALQNLELGYRRTSDRYAFSANYYLMEYRNQLVLTGAINDVGASLRTNVDNSYRTGIEFEGTVKLSNRLRWNANLTLSRNKISSFTEVGYDYGDNWEFSPAQETTKQYTNTDISFSPNVIAGSMLSYLPFRNAEVTLLTKYVGQQYLDNTSNANRKIDAYLVNDIRFSYTWRPSFIKEIAFSVLLNNVFDEMYSSNGYTWGYAGGGAVFRENYYYPQAGRNFLAMISLKF